MLERRRYSERPPRDEYVLTDRSRDFRPVLWSLLAWGNRHFAPEGASVVIVDADTGALADPVLVDRASLRPMTEPAFRTAAGPAANAQTRQRHGVVDGGSHSPSQATEVGHDMRPQGGNP